MESVLQFNQRKRSRLIVQRGQENILLLLNEIGFFYTENRIVYAVDKFGKKYFVDKNLAELALELDRNSFFRANRQYILNINFIRGYKAYEKVKLLVDLTISDVTPVIIISQETAPEFKRWMDEA